MRKATSKTGFDRNLASERRLHAVEDRIDRAAMSKLKYNKRQGSSYNFAKVARFKCQLHIGDSPFPRFDYLTMYEIVVKNNALEDKFRKTFNPQGETTRRLSRWKFSNSGALNAAKKRYMNASMEGVELFDDASYLVEFDIQLLSEE